jgi:hypothetical protein
LIELSKEWSLEMSDSMNEGRDTAGLLDSEGHEKAGVEFCAQIESFVREQPLAAALILLGVGYVMGRLRLIV